MLMIVTVVVQRQATMMNEKMIKIRVRRWGNKIFNHQFYWRMLRINIY